MAAHLSCQTGYILMRNETGDTKDGWIDTCSVSPHSTESSATHPSLGRYRDETSSSSLLDSSCKPNHEVGRSFMGIIAKVRRREEDLRDSVMHAIRPAISFKCQGQHLRSSQVAHGNSGGAAKINSS
ncbi:hypothetical protein ATANTOWER_017025, partial [Ataeniobius toweri]|nr:hypothetical protein [Ataeniobius toweri]